MKKKMSAQKRCVIVLVLFLVSLVSAGIRFFAPVLIPRNYLLLFLFIICTAFFVQMIYFITRNFRTYDMKRSLAVASVAALCFMPNIITITYVFNLFKITYFSVVMLYSIFLFLILVILFVKNYGKNQTRKKY
ncbi:MAG: hypothetical protein ACI9AR_000130 [Flavobacteriaceae bacterium]|jgi:hypothetical protein